LYREPSILKYRVVHGFSSALDPQWESCSDSKGKFGSTSQKSHPLIACFKGFIPRLFMPALLVSFPNAAKCPCTQSCSTRETPSSLGSLSAGYHPKW
jgi:hypothetical protein